MAGALLRLKIAAGGPEMAVSDVSVEGNARLVETKTARPEDKPLLVRGNTLHVTQADTPGAAVAVSGAPAYIEARGMTLSGAVVQMEKSSNRLWIDGAGRMTLPGQGGQFPMAGPGGGRGVTANRGPNPPANSAAKSNAQANAKPLEITWQGSMNFDGLTATYDRSVLARTEQQWLRTERLAVTLKKRVDLGAPQNPESGENDVNIVDCQGGVLIENRSLDERGQASIDQMQLKTLNINQTSGAITGDGPGWVNSVRRALPAATASPASPTPAAGNRAKGPSRRPGKQARIQRQRAHRRLANRAVARPTLRAARPRPRWPRRIR